MAPAQRPSHKNYCIHKIHWNDGTKFKRGDYYQPEGITNQTGEKLRGNSISDQNLLPIYFTLEVTGLVRSVNPQGAACLGYTVEDLVERPIFNLFHPDVRANLQLKFTTVVQHPEQGFLGKFCILNKQGNSLLVNVTAQLLQGNDDNSTFLLTCDRTTAQGVEPGLQEQEPYSCSLTTDSSGELSGVHEHCVAKINECFLSLGSDSIQNINNLTALCGRLLGATCTLYNRLNQGILYCVGQWQLPKDYNPADRPEGHICWDVIQQSRSEPLIVRDLPNTHYAQTDPNVALYQLKTYVGQAVKCRDVYIGSLCAVYQDDVILSEADKRLLGIIATAIGVEEERKQVEEALRQRAEQERLIAGITQHIRQSLNLEEILNTTVAEVRQFLQTDRTIIFRFEPDWTGVVAVESVGEEWPAILGTIIGDSCFEASYVQRYQNGRIQATPDIYSAGLAQCHIDLLAQFQIRANLVVPILQGEQLWGLLIAHHCRGTRQWQSFEIELLQSLATQVAIAIQQSELYKQTQHQAQREQALNRVIQTIRKSLDLTTIFSTATSEIAKLLNADRAGIVQYLPELKIWLNVADYRRNSKLPNELGLEIPDEGNEIATRLKRLEVIRIDDASDWENIMNRAFAPTFPGAWLMVPLHVGPSVWGSLSLVRNTQLSGWQDSEVELTRAVADQIAIAIQQSELLRQVQRLNSNLERQVRARTAQLELAFEFEATLKRITDRVRDSLDEGQIWQTAVQELARVIGVRCCNAALYDFKQGTSTICYEYTTSMPPSKGSVTKMVHLPEIYAQLLQGDCFQFCASFENLGREPVAILVSPIFDNQGIIGDLWLVNHKYYAFQEQDIRLVQQVANHCAIAIRQARLYQAAQAQVEELEKLNRLKDDFLGTVSHELRTPLSNMKMATQMLEIVLKQAGIFDSDTSKAARYFQILKDECHREISLINNLLDLSRLDAGTEALILTTIDPKIWILGIAEPFIERASSQQQYLEFELPSELPSLTTDLSALERILTELLNNACKYTPIEGTIKVSAQATRKMLEVRVSNSGVEIPEQELAHIFDKFYRIPNNDPWKHGGTGLGLALVKKLVEHLEGTIQASSFQGQTTFTLRFPLKAIKL